MTPRDRSGSIWLTCMALLFTTVAVVWAAHNRLAAAVVVGGTVWIGGIVAGLAAWVVAAERGKRIAELTEELDQSDAALEAAETEARIASDLLDQYRADARVVIPIRRGVPVQREPEHDEWDADLMRHDDGLREYEWPHIARQIEHDDLTALIRATEENQ